MTRKSKQPGGHNPLTYHEQKRLKSSGYGTQTARLSTDSQLPFGSCCLGLGPVLADPVATPSGHVYSREAILEYLLKKNTELKRSRAEYEAKVKFLDSKRREWEEGRRIREEELFVRKDQQAISVGASASGRADSVGDANEEGEQRSLKKSSFWLASSQPVHRQNAFNPTLVSGSMKSGDSKAQYDDFCFEEEIKALSGPPPDRPPSPMSGQPLRLKQLIPLHFARESSDDNPVSASDRKNYNGRVLCAVSGKTITTQPVVAIRTSGQVMLLSVYEKFAKPNMTCPVTGKKFKDKDVLELQKGASGFAASGIVLAKKYHPTLT